MQDTPQSPLPTFPADQPVMDLEGFRMLAAVLGPDRMTRMSASFFVDAERRMALLDHSDTVPADLQDHTHALISMAGHLGLKQLSALCMDLQERARRKGGLEGRPALRRAIGEAQAAVQAAVAAGALRDLSCTGATRAETPRAPQAASGRDRMMESGHVAAG